MMLDADALGASLYVPTTHPHLLQIARGEKLCDVRSIIFCTEDAVAEHELPQALKNLAQALASMTHSDRWCRFVRVRNPGVMKIILAMPGIEHIDGFVLPKVTADNLNLYYDQILKTHHCIMPTLETREVFIDDQMQRLLANIDTPARRNRILTLRIGGNDLLSLIGMRRSRGHTIYETPIGNVISRLVTTFRPCGFRLSAPVFEHLNDTETLDKEVQKDLLHGLTGKTAIHPRQIPQIERHYCVRSVDIDAAQRILEVNAAGIFRFDNAMCEPATHRNWALSIINSARHYGLKESVTECS